MKPISFHFMKITIIDYYNDTNKVITSEYNYLLNMPIHSFTLEKVNELQTEIDQKKNDHDTLESKEIKTIWREELDDFEQMYKKCNSLIFMDIFIR